jgi:hypothetical protein
VDFLAVKGKENWYIGLSGVRGLEQQVVESLISGALH